MRVKLVNKYGPNKGKETAKNECKIEHNNNDLEDLTKMGLRES